MTIALWTAPSFIVHIKVQGRGAVRRELLRALGALAGARPRRMRGRGRYAVVSELNGDELATRLAPMYEGLVRLRLESADGRA